MNLKYSIVLTLLYLNSIITNSQVNYQKDYFPIINLAELKIVDSSFNEALALYQKAFKAVPRGFARDFYNASICAIKTRQYPLAFSMLDSLIKKGVRKQFFETMVPYKPLREITQWKEFKNNFDSKYKVWNQDKNLALKNILNGLEYADQEFRLKQGSYSLYEDTIRKSDKMNVKILVHCIEKYGFPNENLIGISNPLDDKMPTDIIFHHQYQKMSKNIHDYDFTEILKTAVQKGELSISKMSRWLSLSNNPKFAFGAVGIYQLQFGEKKSSFLAPKLSISEKEHINKKRLLMGLEKLEDYYRKAIYEFKEKGIKEFYFPSTHLNILVEDKDFKEIPPIFECID